MSQWTDVDPNDLLPGDPWTSGKAQAAFENVEALAEGAERAPRVAATALGGLALPAVTSSGVFAGWTDLERVAELYLTGWYEAGVSVSPLQVRFSIDNGSTWGSSETLFSLPAETDGFIALSINLVTGDYSATRFDAAAVNDTVTVPADVNAFQVRLTPGSGFSAIITGGRE